MACGYWTAINSTIRAGSLVRASDIGAWITTVSSQASTMNSRHCPSNNSSYRSPNFSSDRGHNSHSTSGDSKDSFTKNSSVRYSGFRKCGGETQIKHGYEFFTDKHRAY